MRRVAGVAVHHDDVVHAERVTGERNPTQYEQRGKRQQTKNISYVHSYAPVSFTWERPSYLPRCELRGPITAATTDISYLPIPPECGRNPEPYIYKVLRTASFRGRPFGQNPSFFVRSE